MAGTTQKKEKTVGYNPYKAVSGISENKGLYGTAKATGGDYMQYHTAAAPLYQELYDNGWGDLADELTASDYGGSLEILKRFQPTNLFEEYVNTVSSAPSRQNTAGLDPTSSQWQGTAQDFFEASKNPQMSELEKNMYDSYYQLENTLNGPITKDANGNVVSGLNVDHYNTGKGQLDYLQNFDVTAQPYYEGIMAQYKLLGGDAAQNELAGGASGNSGNIDSFAQANANRQQLAFTTAGINQALAAANQNQQNWQNVYDRMTAHLNNIGVLNNGKLVEAGNVHATDSAERQNALNTAAGLAQQEMQNNMQWYLDLLGYDTTMDATKREIAARLYGVDVDADTNRYISENNLEGTKYAAEAGVKEAEIGAEAQKYGHSTALEGTMYTADTEATMNRESEAAATERLDKEIGAEREIRADENARTAATEAAEAEEQAYKSEAESAVIDYVMDFIYNKNTSFESLQDIYDSVRQTYPNYDVSSLASLINTTYSNSIKNVDEPEQSENENIKSGEVDLFALQAYTDFVNETDKNLASLSDVILAVQYAYGITYSEASNAVSAAMNIYAQNKKATDH